jgi:hypothetical protein
MPDLSILIGFIKEYGVPTFLLVIIIWMLVRSDITINYHPVGRKPPK